MSADIEPVGLARLLFGLLRGAQRGNWRCVVRHWPKRSDAWPIARLSDGVSELLMLYNPRQETIRIGWRRGPAWTRTCAIRVADLLAIRSEGETALTNYLEALQDHLASQERATPAKEQP